MNQSNPTIFSVEETQRSFTLRGVKNPRGLAIIELSKKPLGAIGKGKGLYRPKELVEISQEGIDTQGYRMPSLPELYDIIYNLHQNQQHPAQYELVERVRNHISQLQQGTTLLTSTVALQGYKGGIIHHEGLTIEEKCIPDPEHFFEVADIPRPRFEYDSPKPELVPIDKAERFRERILLKTPDEQGDIHEVLQWYFQQSPVIRSKHRTYTDYEKEKTNERTRTGTTHVTQQDHWAKKDNHFIALDILLPENKKYQALGIRIKEWRPYQ